MPTQLMPGERSIALVRQHWSVLAGHVLGAIVVIVVALILNAKLPDKVGSLSITTLDVSSMPAIRATDSSPVEAQWRSTNSGSSRRNALPPP